MVVIFYKKLESLDRHRVKQRELGAIYTPKEIAKLTIEEGLREINFNKDFKILEPSCGSGVFVFLLLDYFQKNLNINKEDLLKNHIYFIEKEKDTYEKLLYLITSTYQLEENLNFLNQDFLTIDEREEFDLIIGNPPYVSIKELRKNKDYFSFLRKNFSTTQKFFNLYFAFIEKSIKVLKPGGSLVFLIPNSFLVQANFSSLRSYLRNFNIDLIIDFKGREVFKGHNVSNCIIKLTKKQNEGLIEYIDLSLSENLVIEEGSRRKFKDRAVKKDDVFKFLSKDELDFLQEMEKKPLKLKDYIYTGIATLSEEVFLLQKDSLGFYGKIEGQKLYIEKELVRDLIKAGRKQNLFILYPYEEGEEGQAPKIIKEEILAKKYPKAYKYLLRNKEKLLSRDGKKKNPIAWYAYGRQQGLNHSNERIIFPISSKDISFCQLKGNSLVSNGYYIKLPKAYSYTKLLDLLRSDKFKRYVDLKAPKIKGNSYLLRKGIIGNFSFTKEDVEK